MKQSKFLFVTGMAILSFLISTSFFSCLTLNKIDEIEEKRIYISRRLTAKGELNACQLADFFLLNEQSLTREELIDFAQLYIDEATTEGINSDIAFAQMCHETGFLQFGGLVQKEWHNYCGLGAISKEQPGCQFETEQLGVRAHIQHIQAYATTENISLNNELIDPRYSWVHKTKFAVTVGDLAKSWATDPEYAVKLETMLERMEKSVNR